MSSTRSRRFAGVSSPQSAQAARPILLFGKHMPASRKRSRFRHLVWQYYRLHGRHDLPWRQTKDPYKICVSEVMLQQAQGERVKPFYKNFLERFPTAHALAKAPLEDVLKAWQGLGYNRRAKMLQSTAKVVVEQYRSKFPKDIARLEELPGIGPYTARAIAALAFNQDAILLETNTRTAILHHFFARKKSISDTQ